MAANSSSYGIFFSKTKKMLLTKKVSPFGQLWWQSIHKHRIKFRFLQLSWVLFFKMQNEQKDSEWICKYTFFHYADVLKCHVVSYVMFSLANVCRDIFVPFWKRETEKSRIS